MREPTALFSNRRNGQMMMMMMMMMVMMVVTIMMIKKVLFIRILVVKTFSCNFENGTRRFRFL